MTEAEDIARSVQISRANSNKLDDIKSKVDFIARGVKPRQKKGLKGGRHVGRRGATLLLFSLLDAAIGYSLLSYQETDPPTAYHGQLIMMPLNYWAYLWFFTAFVLFVNAFRCNDRFGFTAAVGVTVLWAMSFLIASFLGLSDRSWVSAVTWGAVAIWLVVISGWPEPPLEKKR